MEKLKLLSIIVPVYNEQLCLNEFYRRIITVLSNTNFNYELLFINDGSTDTSLDILKKIYNSNKKVKVISFSRNFGHQNAIWAGLNFCKGDCAVIIDSDLQDPPEIIAEMIKTYENNNTNIIYTIRKKRQGESWHKKATAYVFYRLFNFLSKNQFPLDSGDFCLIDRQVINTLNNFSEKNKYIRGLINWTGLKKQPVYYTRDSRHAGRSKFTYRKSFSLAIDAVTSFSDKLIYIILFTGFFIILTTVLLLLIFFATNYHERISSFKDLALILAIIFSCGLQLLATGIIGIYISRMSLEIKKHPAYIISEKYGLK